MRMTTIPLYSSCTTSSSPVCDQIKLNDMLTSNGALQIVVSRFAPITKLSYTGVLHANKGKNNFIIMQSTFLKYYLHVLA